MVAYPAVVVLIVCKVLFVGEPTENDGYTGHRDTEWDMTSGQMHCKRLQVELTDPDADSGNADPQPFSAAACAVTAMRLGPQFDVEHKDKPWRFYRSACPVPVMDDNGTPDNTRDDRIVGYKIPECPHAGISGTIVCEKDTVI